MGARPRPRLARQRSGQLDHLLEGGPVLEGEGRHRDPTGVHPPVHVVAAGLRVFRAGAAAVDLLRGHREGFRERALQRLAA